MNQLHRGFMMFAALLSLWMAAGEAHARSERRGTPRAFVAPEVLVPGGKAVITYENSDFTGHDVFLHYGFNGWNQPVASAGAGQEVSNGNLNYFAREKMTFDPEQQRYRIEVALPGDARALHFVFCRDRCGSGSWDNNQGKDYARGVSFPYIGPILTWNDKTPPTSGLVISFENPTDGGQRGWLRFWQNDGAVETLEQMPTGSMYRFVLQALRPGTQYSYQVGVGLHQSAVYTFRTLAQQAVGTESLRFLVFGDAQDNGESGRFSAVASAMAQQTDADFAISTGDLPWNDDPGDWWTFFDKARNLFAHKVVMPALGNHDTPGSSSNTNHTSFNYYFAHPGLVNGVSHYRFDVGGARFYALNSERAGDFSKDGVQYRWMNAELTQRRAQLATGRSGWTFAYWHKPPFNVGSRHVGEQYAYRLMAALFAGIVDWQFSGHEHLYQRMKPLSLAADGRGDPLIRSWYGTSPDRNEGVGYLVVPSGGVVPESSLVPFQQNQGLRSLIAYPLVSSSTNRAPTFSGFARIDLDANHMELKTYSVDDAQRAQLIDTVSYEK